MIDFDTRVRDITSYITQGRVISRLVSMFEPAEALVDENDRRQRIDLTDDDDEDREPVQHTLE